MLQFGQSSCYFSYAVKFSVPIFSTSGVGQSLVADSKISFVFSPIFFQYENIFLSAADRNTYIKLKRLSISYQNLKDLELISEQSHKHNLNLVLHQQYFIALWIQSERHQQPTSPSFLWAVRIWYLQSQGVSINMVSGNKMYKFKPYPPFCKSPAALLSEPHLRSCVTLKQQRAFVWGVWTAFWDLALQ